MAFLGEEFNVDDLPVGKGNFEPLPAGWYTAAMTQAELKTTNDGTGQYVKIRYDITGPTHQGRVVFGNLNVRNKSLKAEEIGRSQMGEIMKAIGLAKISDTDEFIGGQISIKLDIRAARTDEATGKTYESSNEVRGWRSMNGSTAPAAPAAMPTPAAKAATAKAAPPWAKK